MMGDLVLLQEEVNPVMSALLENGLEVTALHNHFFWEEPRIFFMHIHGHGKALDLAKRVKPALDLIPRAPAAAPSATPSAAPSAPSSLSDPLYHIAGNTGEAPRLVFTIDLLSGRRKPHAHGTTIRTP